MATSRYSFTFSTADPISFGPFPRWIVGQDPMLIAALNDGQMTASRGDWLHFVLSRVRDRLGGKALDFLFENPDSSHLESDESAFLLSAIDPAELPAAIAQADAWRASICAEPEILATACERSVEFVREQLVSEKHAEYFHGISEDGDDPDYLLGFLGFLHGELCQAKKTGETVIHARLGF